MTITDVVHPLSPSEAGDELDVVTLQDSEVLEALTSMTARQILRRLAESPAPASVLTEEVDRSIQAIGYHLEKFERVGLIAPVATTYSEKGMEMNIYALTTDSFVVRLSEDPQPMQAASRSPDGPGTSSET